MNNSEASQLAIKASTECRTQLNDAEGATCIANVYSPVVNENAKLRMALASVIDALDNGSKVSPHSSIEFLSCIPKEVLISTRGLKEKLHKCQAALAELASASHRRATTLESELSALGKANREAAAELAAWRHGGVTEAILRKQDGYLKCGHDCEIAIGGTSKRLGEWDDAFPDGLDATVKKMADLHLRTVRAEAANRLLSATLQKCLDDAHARGVDAVSLPSVEALREIREACEV